MKSDGWGVVLREKKQTKVGNPQKRPEKKL
jgi:hypothetical protein